MKNKIGNIKKLFLSSSKSKHRIPKDYLFCDKNGIFEDKFYAKDINRSVLITSLSSYELVKKNNIDISYGLLGENLLVDFDPYKLQIGTILCIGDVELQISQECTICNHLSVIDKSLPKLLEKDRGIFAFVRKEGKLNINDDIYLVIK